MNTDTSSNISTLENRTLAIVDVETSGTSAFDRIIEIGILRIENGVCVETYQTCINPEQEISPWITKLTGITQEEVDRAPTFAEVVSDIERLLRGAIFVAHNVAFDFSFVKRECALLDRYFEAPCMCTVRLSRLLSPRAKHHNLSAIIERHKLVCESRHRAYDDAHALWQFLQWAHRRHKARLAHSIKHLLNTDRTAASFAMRMPEKSEGEVVIR